MIDLRSDTLTKPTAQMRQAMAKATVGDDVFGEDPTVQMLEKYTAEILGKEAALYMPSGTMSNQVAIRSQTEPGDEILLDAESHCYFYESGAPAAFAGVMCRLLPEKKGIFTAQDVLSALRPKNVHYPPAKVIWIENTHNRGGGSIWPVERIAEIAAVAKKAKLKMHLDGARLWNASAATGISEKEYAKYFDSVSVCFSKGLGAPVGSALAGSSEFIDRARRFRKQFGGGMRQAGIIAAGALFAVKHNRARLVKDHKNAKELARNIAVLPGVELDVETVETNMVLFRVSSKSADQVAKQLYRSGVYVLAIGPDMIRAVTNLNVSSRQIKEAVATFKKVFKK